MQTSTAYMEHCKQVVGMGCKSQSPSGRCLQGWWRITAETLWDFQIQTDKLVMAYQVDKLQRKAEVIDVAIPNDSNTKNTEFREIEKYKGLKE